MKKRVLSLLLTLALVMGMVVLPAAAIPEATETRPSATYEADVWYEANTAEQLLGCPTPPVTYHQLLSWKNCCGDTLQLQSDQTLTQLKTQLKL